MVKVIVERQHDLTDCGPACLSSIIQYFGGYVPLESIRLNCNTSTSGTFANDLMSAAKKYNLSSKAIKIENLEHVKKNNLCPSVAHVVLKNGLNHYVCIYKVMKNKILIMDPAQGKLEINIKDFMQIFSGIIICFYPIGKVSRYEKPVGFTSYIKDLLIDNKKITMRLIILSLLATLFTIISTYFLKSLSYLLESGYGLSVICYVGIIFAFVYLLKNIFNYIRSKQLVDLEKNINAEQYEKLSHKLFNLPLNYIKSRTSGEVITRFNELIQISDLLPNIVMLFTVDLIMIISSFIISYSISKELTLITLIIMFLYFLILKIYYNPTNRKINKNINCCAQLNTQIIDNVNSLISTKYLNNEKQMEKRLEKAAVQYLHDNYNLEKYLLNYELIISAIFDLLNYLLIFTGIYLIYIGKLTLIDIFTFMILNDYITNPVKNMCDILPKLSFVKIAYKKMSEYLLVSNESGGIYNFKNGDINISNLSYAYNNIDMIINNFSCYIKKGCKVLVQGKSGCGKSTLCKLISKQLELNSGEIKIDNINIQDIKEDQLRENVTYIGQKDSLLVDTIKNNIIYERKIDEENLKTICKMCEIDNIVKNRFDRYDTIINESSMNISGGEKQRIILARGLIKCGEIIILDEALSEVNSEMEERIVKNIIKHFNDKTIIYVSHKKYKGLFNQRIFI